MTLVDTEKFRQGGAPTVFVDRTIFPPPELVGERVGSKPQVVHRTSPLMAVIALIALVGCGFLGWQLWEARDGANETATSALEKEITDLKATIARTDATHAAEIASLEAERQEFESIATLLETSEELKQDIARLVADPTRSTMPTDREPYLVDSNVDWRAPATEILNTYIADQRRAKEAMLTFTNRQVQASPQPSNIP